MKQIRLLLVKYPDFVDMKAALAVLYWKQGRHTFSFSGTP
jgi:hypothetical protein